MTRNDSWKSSGRPRSGRLFTVELLVEALDRTHLLSDITRTISDAGVNILSARVDTIEDRTALSRFAFRAASVQHVDEVIRKIRGIPDVYDVRRISRDGTPLERQEILVSEVEQVTVSMDGFEVNSYVVHGPRWRRDRRRRGRAREDPGGRAADPWKPFSSPTATPTTWTPLVDVLSETNAPIYVHPDDAERADVSVYEPLDDGQELRIAGETFLVFHTPGHSPGSVTL